MGFWNEAWRFVRREAPKQGPTTVSTVKPEQTLANFYVGILPEKWDRDEVLGKLKEQLGDRADEVMVVIERRREDWYRKR